MRTSFTPEQLQDPKLAQANKILRNCVHCGMCTATCPTYHVLGNELDSPRGRIYLIKEMLETGRVPDAKTVQHIDRCLGCLSCMTTCPAGVDYMHLVDQARVYIEKNYRRPWFDRLLRRMLSLILPYPMRFRVALFGAKLLRPVARFVPDARLRAMLMMAPKYVPPVSRRDDPQVFRAVGPVKMRVALLTGCAQKALNTDINDATIRLLCRLGCEVVIAKDMGCCGALNQHMGYEDKSRAEAGANIRAWMQEKHQNGLDAVVINTSGCGTVVKDYGHMLAGGPLANDAAEISAMAMDISEVLARLDLSACHTQVPLRVAYHAACSLQHGQKVKNTPKNLLEQAGFTVVEPENAHLCCGSAGTYNLLQPEIAGELRDRKVASLEALAPDVIAAGNIGCMMQIGMAGKRPVVHLVELLDWAGGGPKPRALCD